MRKLLPVLLALFVCVSFGAQAQTSIGFVDVEKVLNEVDAAKELNKKRADARDKFLAAVTDMEKSLREEGAAIVEKRDDLSDEELLEKKKEYDSQLNEMRGVTQKKKRAFDEASAKALDELQGHLTEAVKAIAKEREYDLVISNRNLVAGDKNLDITEDVIKAINAKKITIPFKVEE